MPGVRNDNLEDWVASTAAEQDQEPDIGWYGARGFHLVFGALEERVILIRASDRQSAVRAARREFLMYEDQTGAPFEGTIQIFAMASEPEHGAEVFSVGRVPARRARSRILRTIMHEAVAEGQRLIQVPRSRPKQ